MKLKKRVISLAVLAIAAGFAFFEMESSEVQEQLSEKKVVKNRSVASATPAVVVKEAEIVAPQGAEVRDQQAFMIEAKKDSMSLDSFKSEIEKISKQIGWDLFVETTADGNTHIKSKQVVQDFKDTPLPAFTNEEWASVQENLLDIINEGQSPELTRDDQIALEKWNASN